MRQLSDELLKKNTASLNKLSIIIVLHLHVRHINGECNLLRDSRDEAAWPALEQTNAKGLELIESSLAGELALSIATSHSVLGHFPNFYWIPHCKYRCLLLRFVLVVLLGAFYLLTLVIERHDLLNQIGLGVVRAICQVLAACGIFRVGCGRL